MSRILHHLVIFLNAIQTPIPTRCAEGEENRKGEMEKQSERTGGWKAWIHQGIKIKLTLFLPWGPAGIWHSWSQKPFARKLTSHHGRPRKKAIETKHLHHSQHLVLTLYTNALHHSSPAGAQEQWGSGREMLGFANSFGEDCSPNTDFIWQFEIWRKSMTAIPLPVHLMNSKKKRRFNRIKPNSWLRVNDPL